MPSQPLMTKIGQWAMGQWAMGHMPSNTKVPLAKPSWPLALAPRPQSFVLQPHFFPQVQLLLASNGIGTIPKDF
jgi:hypothetical protein